MEDSVNIPILEKRLRIERGIKPINAPAGSVKIKNNAMDSLLYRSKNKIIANKIPSHAPRDHVKTKHASPERNEPTPSIRTDTFAFSSKNKVNEKGTVSNR